MTKTADLVGVTLDWAVAKCLEAVGHDNAERFLRDHRIGFTTAYSSNWSQGGPIIDREFISVSPGDWDVDATPVVKNVRAWSLEAEIHGSESFYYGPTALIAAMRCFAASKLGDEVDVPDELL